MSRNDLAGGEMEGRGDGKAPQLDTATHVIDEYLQYLDGDRRDAPSLDELDQDERPEIEELIDLLTASYDAGTPGAPPLGQDRILTKLRRNAVTDEAGVKRLMEVLPGEPNVLGQAFAYLQDTRTTPDDYLHRWIELIDDRSVRQALAALHSPAPDGSPRRRRSRAELRADRELAATRWLSLDYLWRHKPGAAALLKACAFMAPGEIPSSLFTGKHTLLPGSLQTINADPAAFDSALRALRRYFLATDDLETLLIDPLVQALVRDSLDRRERQHWASAAVRLLNEDFPAKSEDPPTWPACAQLLPHALASAASARRHQVMAKTEGSLLHRTATYLLEKPEFQAAKEQFQRAVAIRETALGPDHPEVANSLDGLGLTLRELWDLHDARAYFERALAIRETALGPDHPEVAITLDGLGLTVRDLGDFNQARAYFERALAIRQTALGPDHPEVAITLDGLGLVARDLGNRRAARRIFKRSLKITKATYGLEHQRSATVLNNLGLVLLDLKDLYGAKEQFELALAIRGRAYPPRHPRVGTVLHNLGLVLCELGDLRRARDLLERALFIHGAAYGWSHPRSAAISDNLGRARSGLGEHPEEVIARRADGSRPASQRELASALGNVEEAVQRLDGVDPAGVIVRQALRDVSAVIVPMQREAPPNHVRRGIAAVDVLRPTNSAA
jgi:tetratricopeptide (TPR) repeat protein